LQNLILGHAVEVDLLQQPIPLILLSLGHVCSFAISTTDWLITQTLGQARPVIMRQFAVLSLVHLSGILYI
ncbi:MAG: hypothetical protein LBP60_06860, partial [Spirochaetaceae bacterium]|nr:hypothetical protein [Spirochaetaceae bacterium]